MVWNWQQEDWPNFTWNAPRLVRAEQKFLVGGGMLIGAARHLGNEERETLTVELMSGEALTTSEIEGETLDRASVQSSILQQLGLASDHRRVEPREYGIVEMTVAVQRDFAAPLTAETLCSWQAMVANGRRDLTDIGRYRTHAEPMQVVSGAIGRTRVHFEAPPSARVPPEMGRFLDWFNETEETLPALTRAGIAHLYFESIHPFEDGNGRVGRAVAQKALAQGLGQPAFVSLSATLLVRRKGYYEALEAAGRSNEITDWLAWFAAVGIEGQRRTLAHVEFLLDKVRLLDRLRGRLNPRQEKALLRMFREGPEGFVGGLTAKKYIAITGTTAPTATRDLGDLAVKGALWRDGAFKATRYHLAVPPRPTARVTINEQGEIVEEDDPGHADAL